MSYLMSLMCSHFSKTTTKGVHSSYVFKRFTNINIMSSNIYDVCRFTYLMVKVLGFNFLTVEFGSFNKGQIKTTIYDYFLFFVSLIYSVFARFYLSKVTLKDSTKSIVLETASHLIMNFSLLLIIFLKLWNFLIREKYAKIISNIHWIDLQVIKVQF